MDHPKETSERLLSLSNLFYYCRYSGRLQTNFPSHLLLLSLFPTCTSQLLCWAFCIHCNGSPSWLSCSLAEENYLSPLFYAFFLSHKPFFHTRNLFWLIYWLNVLYNTHLMTLCPSWGKFVVLWKNLRIHFLSPTWNPRDSQECC